MCYIVKGLRQMNYLVRNGFDVIKLEEDRNNPKFRVFCFKDSPELRECLKNYR